jgi:hypothetical protein
LRALATADVADDVGVHEGSSSSASEPERSHGRTASISERRGHPGV